MAGPTRWRLIGGLALSPEVINALFQGAVLVLGALGLTAANRGRRQVVTRKDYRALQRRYLASLAHLFAVESELAARGIPVPTRPVELEDDDDDGPALPPTPQPAHP